MCDPVTLGSIGLMLAGTGANVIGQNQVQNARNDALSAERIRQAALDKEAAATQEASRQRFDNYGEQQDQRSSELAKLYRDTQAQVVAPQAAAEAAPTAGADSVVARERAKQQNKTDTFNNQQADAQGAVSGFGDLLGQKSRELARDAGKIGQIGSFKKGSSQALAYELQDANSAGNMWSFLGDLGRGLGSVGVAYGLRAPAAAATNTVTRATLPLSTSINNAASGSLVGLY